MLFNSYICIFVFLPITFFIYFYLNKKWLTESSKIFLVLEHSKVSKKSLLTFGVVTNVVLLGYSKYAAFLIENINLAANSHIPLLHLALPFYLFGLRGFFSNDGTLSPLVGLFVMVALSVIFSLLYYQKALRFGKIS